MNMTPIFRCICFLLLCSVLLIGCSEHDNDARDPVSRPVKLFEVGLTQQAQTLRFPGSVSAVQQANMAFEVSGRVTELPVPEGTLVDRGTVLARLDPRDFEAGRARARAERDAARADFNRYDRAFKAQAVTAQQVDIARRALDVAEAGLQQANKALEDTVLRAPFTGRVARKLIEDFANVQAKEPVLVLQSDDFEMQVHVPEADWARGEPVESAEEIVAGGLINVVLSAYPTQPMPAHITAFSSSADPVTRTFEVTVGFEVPEGVAISPGMTGHVAYEVLPEKGDQGLTVPADAVLANADGTPFVWLYDDAAGSVTERVIVIGAPSGNSVRVLSGLQQGDRIAVSGVHTLRNGTAVHPMHESEGGL